mgnify:FL=1
MKQYFIPMEVTSETIRDFDIDPQDVEWWWIGNRRESVVKIPVTEEVYREYMRPIWREQKEATRAKKLCVNQSRKDACNHDCDHCTQPVFRESSIDMMPEEAVSSMSLEDFCIQKLMIEQLLEAMEDLAPEDRRLLQLIGEGESERTIAEILGKSKTAVHKRKDSLYAVLRDFFENRVTVSAVSVRSPVKGGKRNAKQGNRSRSHGNQSDCP